MQWRGTYDGDSPLVSGDDGTTNGLGSNLGHVHDDDSGDETDAESSDDTATDEETETSGRDLERDTNREDSTSDDDGKTTSDPVRERTTEDGSEEGTSRKDRCCQTWTAQSVRHSESMAMEAGILFSHVWMLYPDESMSRLTG